MEEKEVEAVVEPKEETQAVDTQEAPKVEEKKTNHNSWETRVNKLTWQKNEEKRKNEELQKRVEELESATRIKEKPVEDNYENFRDYDRDLDKYNSQQQKLAQADIDRRVQEGIEQAQSERERKKITDKYNDKREKAFEKYTDFGYSEQTINEALQNKPEVVKLIIESDNSDAIVNHFGTNPEALAKLQNSSLVSAVRLIDGVSTQEVKSVSQAPEPTDNKSNGSTNEKDVEKMSQSEYMKWRKENGF